MNNIEMIAERLKVLSANLALNALKDFDTNIAIVLYRSRELKLFCLDKVSHYLEKK